MYYTLLLITFYGVMLSASGACQNGGKQVLILRLKDVTQGTFNKAISNTGLENPDNPEANTYSIIGNLNKDDFKDANGTYELYLVYGGTVSGHNPKDPIQLRWKQRTWITEATNTLNNAHGFEVINFDPPEVVTGDARFIGLGKSDYPQHCYLDGTGTGSNWWNCVGEITRWQTPGIASYNGGNSKSQALYACKFDADPCSGVTCTNEKVCVNGTCSRDCSWLDIDGFLNDCSNEFGTTNGKIGTINGKLVSLEQQIKDNDGDVQTNKDDIDANAANITKLRTDVDANDVDITDLQSKFSAQQLKINELEAAIEEFKTKLKKSSASGFDEEYHRKYYDENMYKPYHGWSWESMSWQNIAIIVVIILLMLNLIIMTYKNCGGKKQRQQRYQRVRYMDSEDVDAEANLK